MAAAAGPGTLVIVIGTPDRPQVDAAALGDTLANLDLSASRVLLSAPWATPGALTTLSGALAEYVGEPVHAAVGLPVTAGGGYSSRILDRHGDPTWEPYLTRLRSTGSQHVTTSGWRSAGARWEVTAPGVFRAFPFWELEAVPAGLWLRPEHPVERFPRFRPPDPTRPLLIVGEQGRPVSQEIWEELVPVLDLLPPPRARGLGLLVNGVLTPGSEAVARFVARLHHLIWLGSEGAPPRQTALPGPALALPRPAVAPSGPGLVLLRPTSRYPGAAGASVPTTGHNPTPLGPVPTATGLDPGDGTQVGTAPATGTPYDAPEAAPDLPPPLPPVPVPVPTVTSGSVPPQLGSPDPSVSPAGPQSLSTHDPSTAAPPRGSEAAAVEAILGSGLPDGPAVTVRNEPSAQPTATGTEDTDDTESTAGTEPAPRITVFAAEDFPVAARVSSRETREAVRVLLGNHYQRCASRADHLATRLPGLRSTAKDDIKPDLVAVQLYHSDDDIPAPRAELTAAARNPEPGPLTPFLDCLGSGLRRLPSHHGAVLFGAEADESLLSCYEPGRELFEPAAVTGLTLHTVGLGVPVEFAVWSTTGRRTSLLGASGEEPQVVFPPGTRFVVVDVLPGVSGSRPDRVLLREAAGSAGTDSADRDRSARERLVSWLGKRDRTPEAERRPVERPERFLLTPGCGGLLNPLIS
ncbi:hypothetical protein [Kitasatospora sp. NE20-6]|uniref:hypothetical protein n=1 Tax=Kitasatospora sp. NE20-6 TaxID=2859066 RepID=UPI0038B2BBB1